MSDMTEILKLRTLLYFLNNGSVNCGPSNIARAFGVEKYHITRLMANMEKEGLLIRNGRSPVLTQKGTEQAEFYAERLRVIMNHLMYEGVDEEIAEKDAISLALCISEDSMKVFREAEERYRVKYELRDHLHFSGAALCKKLKDGHYSFPFIIYREQEKNGSNLSMANAGFKHPCTLSVKNGVGTILLRVKPMRAVSGKDGKIMQGSVQTLQYMHYDKFIRAESKGSLISIPAESLQFVNIGSDIGQILHGSVCVKVASSVGAPHMQESTAIFTILI